MAFFQLKCFRSPFQQSSFVSKEKKFCDRTITITNITLRYTSRPFHLRIFLSLRIYTCNEFSLCVWVYCIFLCVKYKEILRQFDIYARKIRCSSIANSTQLFYLKLNFILFFICRLINQFLIIFPELHLFEREFMFPNIFQINI